MAQVIVNGGANKTRLRIVPEPPPETVRAYRDLELIRRELAHFQHEFANTPETVEAVHERAKDVNRLTGKYVEILETCARALAKDIDSMPEEKRRYYAPVLIFLSRASNAHTILPFGKYVADYRNILARPEVLTRYPIMPSLAYYRGFIEDRIAESLHTCEAYCSLLSNSLGAYMRFFPLSEMLFRIAITQREVSILQRARFVDKHKPEGFATLREQHKKGVVFDLAPTGEVFGIPSLAYFLVLQTISNAFKASFGAYWAQKKKEHIGESYVSMPELPEPMVELSLARVDAAHVKAVITDNGMGVPLGMLDRLMEVDKERQFSTFHVSIQVSNGSSMALFPFLADLIGVEIVLASEGIGQGFTVELTFPVDINMRTLDKNSAQAQPG